MKGVKGQGETVALARWGCCPGGNIELRRAGEKGVDRKLRRENELRGPVAAGRRRKWWSTGKGVEGEVALMANRVPSRGLPRGCDRNRVFLLDTPLVRDTHLRTYYQPQVQASRQVTGRGGGARKGRAARYWTSSRFSRKNGFGGPGRVAVACSVVRTS